MLRSAIDALRLVRRRPAFCAAVSGITALSVGSCTAIFSIVIAVLYPSWPYATPERLAIVWHANGTAAGVIGLSPGDYTAYRDATRSFETVTALSTRGYNVGGAAEPARVTCARATPEMFPMLGVSARSGRWFTQDDDRSAGRVVVVSDQLWRRQFGSDEWRRNRSLMLNAVPYTVVGVMPASFSFPPAGVQGTIEADCWLPTSFMPAELATPGFDFVVVGKLKPGVSLEQAATDAATVTRGIWESYPAAVQAQVQLRSRVVRLTEHVVASSRTPLAMFTGSVVLLLLIGCANVSNLMLTRFKARQRELAVRTALGATQWSLVTQLLAESVVLATLGSAGGILLAEGLVRTTVAFGSGVFPRLEEARVDVLSLGVALACAVVAGVLGGAAPALRSRSTGGSGVAGERTVTGNFRRDRLRSGLVIVEIAMAVVLLTAAGLLVRSIINLNRIDTGFQPRGVLTFAIALPPTAYPRAEAVDRFSRAVIEQLEQVPTVSVAAAGSGLPLGRTDVAVVSLPEAGSGAPQYRPVALQTVTPGYDEAFGMTVTQGRTFAASDTLGGAPVAVVSTTMARSYWPGVDVIGKSIVRLGDPRPLTIVGVMADVRQGGPHRSPPPTLYVPVAQAVQPLSTLAFVVRTSADPAQIAPHVRRVVAEADGTLPVFAFRTGEELVSTATATQRFNMLVVVMFAALALCLAVAGLYALMAFMVAQSSREFGIRMAMGATVTGIARLVVGRAAALLVPGLLIGVAVAASLSHLVASLLFGVQPNDPATFGLVVTLLLALSSAAVVIPAVRAARVDPVTCLRHE